MKTLYKQLRPEVKTALESEAVKYPATVGSLIEKLKAEISYYSLKLNDFSDLVNYGLTITERTYSITKAYNKLFINEQ